jgi:hypothetical protein
VSVADQLPSNCLTVIVTTSMNTVPFQGMKLRKNQSFGCATLEEEDSVGMAATVDITEE